MKKTRERKRRQMNSIIETRVIYLGFCGFKLVMSKLFLIRMRSFPDLKSFQENVFTDCVIDTNLCPAVGRIIC